MTRVLVCGSRDYSSFVSLITVLDKLHVEFDFSVVIEGAASGADRLASRWAVARGVAVEEYPADWKTYGVAAGPIRNKQMLDEGKPDLVVAFPRGPLAASKGTKNMVDQATKAGLPVIVVNGETLDRRPPGQYMIDEEGSLA